MALDFLIQLLVNGFIIGLLYGVVAMAFVLIYKSSLVVNFAQGEFLLIGAWACWWLLAKFSLPFYLAFIFTFYYMICTVDAYLQKYSSVFAYTYMPRKQTTPELLFAVYLEMPNRE